MSLFKKIKQKAENIRYWRFAQRKSKTAMLPGFQSITLHDTWTNIKTKVDWDDFIERTSAISFNSAMALPPTILFLCTLIPFMPISQQFILELNQLIKSIVPGQKNYEAIIHFLDDILNRERSGLLVFGFFLSIFFSSNAMMGVMRSFDKDYPGFKKRKGIKKRLAAIKITLLLFFLFFLCLALMIAQDSVLQWMGIENKILSAALSKVRWVLIFLLVFFIISFIYRHAPSVHKKWKLITPGSVLATCLIVIFALLFSWWVGKFESYNKLYLSIGTVIVVMVLIFVTSLILLIGFELNASIYSLARTAKDKEELVNEA